MIILKTPVPFNQFSSSPSDLPKRLLSSSKSMSVVFPCSRQCTQQIWNKIFIVFAILGKCIMISKFSVWKWRMHIQTPGWHTVDFITFVSLSVPWWCKWRSRLTWPSGQRCRRFWWRCGSSFAPPACLQIVCCIILAWKAAGRMIFIKYCWMSFPRSLHLLMPRILNSSLLLFSDFSMCFLDQLLCFLYCGSRKPSFGCFCHIQGKVHVGLFQLYWTSLPRHSSRHVENLQEISGCC